MMLIMALFRDIIEHPNYLTAKFFMQRTKEKKKKKKKEKKKKKKKMKVRTLE